MVTVDVRSNVADCMAHMKATFADGVPTATFRALNKVGPQVRTAAIAGVRAIYKIKASAVRKSFDIRKASKNNLSTTVYTTGAPLPLYVFGAKQVKTGVSVNVRGTRKIVQGAFIAAMPNGHMGVFTRAPGAKTKNKNGKRTALPIDEKFSVSLPGTVALPVIERAMVDVVDTKFPALLQHEFQYLLGQRGFK